MADAARECWTRALKVSQPSLDPYQCPVYSPKPDRAGSQKFHSQHHLHSLKGTDFSDLSVWPSLSESEISAFAKIPQSTSIANTGWRRFAAKGCNFLKTVHRFAPAFDVFVQQQPFLATLVWGTARFLLQAVLSSTFLTNKVVSALRLIVTRLTTLELEVNLFGCQQKVLNSVTAFFTQVILFLVQTRVYFGRPKAWRVITAAFTNDFDEPLESIKRHATAMAEVLRVTALKAQVHENQKQDIYRGESSAAFKRLLDGQEQLFATKAPGTMQSYSPELLHRFPFERITTSRVIDWLSTGVLDADTIPDAEPDTCLALFQHRAWREWEAADCPTSFLIAGVQGVGKSVHAQAITTRAKEQGSRVVVSHFFRGTATCQSTRAESFAITALWQLCNDQAVAGGKAFPSVLRKFAPFLNAYPDVWSCRLKGLLQLLDTVISVVEELLVVVDALDECTTDATALHKYLFELGRRDHTQVVVSARNELLLSDCGENTPYARLDRALVEPDIKLFLERNTQKNPNFRPLKDEIVRTVLEHSQGIFLHARVLLEDLDSARSIAEQKEKMAHFGDQVEEEYQRLFLENESSLPSTQRERRDNIFRLLLAARTPLTAQSISEVLAFDDTTGRIDEDDILFEPAKEITHLCQPLIEVELKGVVCFIHNSARDFLVNKHLTLLESDLFLTRKSLGALRQSQYQESGVPAQLLRNHLLAGTIYANIAGKIFKGSALYDYATLHFQDHVIELKNPPEDILTQLAGFLRGIEFVSWSEHLLDLTKQSSLGNQIAVYNVLLDWTKALPAPIKSDVPIEDYFEIAHIALSATLADSSKDNILQYLPLVRNGNYFNGGGQSANDWQKAYDSKMKVVAGVTELLGSDNPVTLRFMASLLQEYFWQKRFEEALPGVLTVVAAQRKLGSAGEADLYTTLWLLGMAYHCLTMFEEALQIFTEAADGVAHRFGKLDRRYLLIGLYKGHTLEQLFRFDEAALLYEDVRGTLTPIVGSTNGFTLMSQTAIGAVQRKQGDYENATKNLLEGWAGRKRIFSINVNICLDAAVQLALLYRDNRNSELCLELLRDVSSSIVFEQDFERYCQTVHIQSLVAFDNGDFDEPKLALLRLLHKASGSDRALNNRELLWIRSTLAQVLRYQGCADEALMLFSDLVEPAEHEDDSSSDEPEPPSQLRIAEQALRMVRQARRSHAKDLLRSNGLRWVREADFYVLGEGGPFTDTAVIAPIAFASKVPPA